MQQAVDAEREGHFGDALSKYEEALRLLRAAQNHEQLLPDQRGRLQQYVRRVEAQCAALRKKADLAPASERLEEPQPKIGKPEPKPAAMRVQTSIPFRQRQSSSICDEPPQQNAPEESPAKAQSPTPSKPDDPSPPPSQPNKKQQDPSSRPTAQKTRWSSSFSRFD